ncbi:hypothetical protein B0T09DRAFT_326728 [Sordaria sp. MPI-SDFR-AT-0083]|nr:hypothetical protein B0T09DRAFT_326728 [Sordaria sp. MPI-SDFR-AT-0083]
MGMEMGRRRDGRGQFLCALAPEASSLLRQCRSNAVFSGWAPLQRRAASSSSAPHSSLRCSFIRLVQSTAVCEQLSRSLFGQLHLTAPLHVPGQQMSRKCMQLG